MVFDPHRAGGSAMEDRLEQDPAGEGPTPLAFFSIYDVTAIGLYLCQRGGWYTLLSPLAMTFVAVPVFDVLLGVDRRNPPETPPGRVARVIYRLATWIAVP